MSLAAERSRAACVDWIRERRGESGGCDPEAVDEWLLAHGLAAVAVADPAGFEIPGPFLVRFAAGWAVEFGVTAGVVHDPLGVAAGEVLEAQVLVPLALERGARPAHAGSTVGTIVAIAIAPAAEAPMTGLDSVRVAAGAGLEGDRYSRGAGTFSARGGSGRDITLIEAEALDELAERGIALEPLAARRNIVAGGIDLDALIGRRFRLGEVECAGRRRCEPCAVLERLTEPGVLRGLVHRGGLRADALSDGVIYVGDRVEALE